MDIQFRIFKWIDLCGQLVLVVIEAYSYTNKGYSEVVSTPVGLLVYWQVLSYIINSVAKYPYWDSGDRKHYAILLDVLTVSAVVLLTGFHNPGISAAIALYLLAFGVPLFCISYFLITAGELLKISRRRKQTFS